MFESGRVNSRWSCRYRSRNCCTLPDCCTILDRYMLPGCCMLLSRCTLLGPLHAPASTTPVPVFKNTRQNHGSKDSGNVMDPTDYSVPRHG